jgi:hypothetical protein
MSLFDSFMGTDNPANDNERTMDRAFKTYYRGRLAVDVAEHAGNWLNGGNERERLDEADKRLSIRLKKKQLGLPMSGDDYEVAENNDQTFSNAHKAIFAKNVGESISAPRFLSTQRARGLLEGSFPKTTHGPVDALLSSGMRVSGATHGGRDLGVIARLFRK